MQSPSLESVPALPESRPLELSDKPLLDSLLAAQPPEISELTFTNLFVWREIYPVRLARWHNALLIRRGHEGEGYLLPPLGELSAELIAPAFAWLRQLGDPPAFGRVPHSVATRLAKLDPALALTEDRDNADYVYLTRDLAELKGRHYDGKRNLIKKFEKIAPGYASRPAEAALLPAMAALQETWCVAHDCGIHADLEAESQAIAEALRLWEALNLMGCVLKIGETVIGFAVAEQLAPGVGVVHFEKGDPAFPGIYQALNQCCCVETLRGFEFVNREQDLGLEGLRKAKTSYRPNHLVLKYTVKY